MPEPVRWLLSSPIGWALLAVLAVAVAGMPVALWWERRSPSSYTRDDGLAWWGLLPAEEQEAVDAAALELGAQAEIDARQDAAEAAGFLAHRAQTDSPFRP